MLNYPNMQQSCCKQVFHVIRSWLFIILALTGVGAYASGGESGGAAIIDGQTNYYSLEPTFVVNVLDGTNLRFMQISIDVMSMDSKAIEAIQDHHAPIRHELLMLFAYRDLSEVMGIQNREQLRQEALKRIQDTLLKYAHINSDAKGETEDGKKYPLGIQEVLFTSFVIQ